MNQIEKYYISFLEPTAAGGQERRVFFSDAMDMDFLFYDVKESERLAAENTIQSFFSHGYDVKKSGRGSARFNILNGVSSNKVTELIERIRGNRYV